jgi:hypothetical protein
VRGKSSFSALMTYLFFEDLERYGSITLIHTTPPRPHIKLECVDLCGVGTIKGLSDHHRVPSPQKKGTSLAKHAFLAVERCAMSIFIFISRYTQNFSLHFVKEVRRSIRNTP